MALYEYSCDACGAHFERRMSMSDVLQLVPCESCGKQAKKVIGNFAVVGIANAGFEDGPAPWESDGGGDDDFGGDDGGFGGHGHSHGPGGHTH
jgi:putative FmdB family regulatory protein